MSTIQRETSANTLMPCAPTSVPAARRFVRAALRHHGDPYQLYVAVLLTSELATNAVRHARSDFELTVTTEHDRIRIEASDCSAVPPIVRDSAPETPGGNGMVLVSSLASDWGFQDTGDGKVVWFELEPCDGDDRWDGAGRLA